MVDFGIVVVAHVVGGVAVDADGGAGQAAPVQALAVDGLGIVGQHAVLGDVGEIADPGALLVAAAAHDGDVELVDRRLGIFRRRDVVGAVAGPAAGRQGNALGHADAVQAVGVDLGHVVVAHGAVDILEFIVVRPVIEAVEVLVAVDAAPDPPGRESNSGTSRYRMNSEMTRSPSFLVSSSSSWQSRQSSAV